MRRFILSLALAFVIAPLGAAPAPRVLTAEECMAYADLALVAAALAKHGVPRATVDAALPDIYTMNSAQAQEIAPQGVCHGLRHWLPSQRRGPERRSRSEVVTCP